MKEKTTIADVIWRILLALWAVSILFPILWMIMLSLKTNQEFYRESVWALPQAAQWGNYIKAWTRLGIGDSFLNTLYYVGMSLLIGTFMTTINAYALTRLEFKGRKLIWALIIMSLFLPGINALVPQYVLMRSLKLTNSLTGLIILSSFGQSVFSLYVLGGFMQSIPKELEESAFIDGASIFKTFGSIVVPMAIPGIVTIAIFSFLGLYNNFLGPFIYLSDPKKYTVAVNMYAANQLMQYRSDWVTLCAAVILAMIPSIVVYILFQKQIVKGATLGSLKG